MRSGATLVPYVRAKLKKRRLAIAMETTKSPMNQQMHVNDADKPLIDELIRHIDDLTKAIILVQRKGAFSLLRIGLKDGKSESTFMSRKQTS